MTTINRAFVLRRAGLALAIPALALAAAGCASEDSAAETTGGGLPDYCQQVTGDALKNIIADVRGTANAEAVYAVKAETAPDFGSFAREGLYFVAVPTSGADASGEPADAVPVLAVSGDFLVDGGGLVFPGDTVSKAYFRYLGTEVEPSGVVGYDASQEAADQSRECAELAVGLRKAAAVSGK